MKHQKSIAIEVVGQASYKELQQLARKHFGIPTKIFNFLGNYQGDSLHQALINVETHVLALKKNIIDYKFALPKKVCQNSSSNH